MIQVKSFGGEGGDIGKTIKGVTSEANNWLDTIYTNSKVISITPCMAERGPNANGCKYVLTVVYDASEA